MIIVGLMLRVFGMRGLGRISMGWKMGYPASEKASPFTFVKSKTPDG
jgi:hypothetical protein